MPRSVDEDDAFHAGRRTGGHIYFSRPFPLQEEPDPDGQVGKVGQMARFACEVLDTRGALVETSDGYEVTLRETPKARQQIKALFLEDDRKIARLILQRFRSDGSSFKGETVFSFSGREVDLLREFLELIGAVDLPADVESVRLNLSTIRQVLASPESRTELYRSDPRAITRLIESDESARDVIAWAARRAQLERFSRLLHNEELFEAEGRKQGGEVVWQNFFEENKWVFGTGLAAQVLTSWDEQRLQQTVREADVAGAGKRADALMRTRGALSSLCFVEIKTHKTNLLVSPYRSDTWRPTPELVGAVAQCHATVEAAQSVMDRELRARDDKGAYTGVSAYLYYPRSYLVVGRLQEFMDGGQVNLPIVPIFRTIPQKLDKPRDHHLR